MAKTNERLPVTFDSLVAAVRAETHIPEGAWTVREFARKAGVHDEVARTRLSKLVSDGVLVQGGPRRSYYWPA
jgi:predicted HTH transcriptional regulator